MINELHVARNNFTSEGVMRIFYKRYKDKIYVIKIIRH